MVWSPPRSRVPRREAGLGLYGFFGHPRDNGDSAGEVLFDALDLSELTGHSLAKRRVARSRRGQTGIHDPSKGLDVRAPKVGLKIGGFGDRSRFGQRDHENLRVVGILDAHERGRESFGFVRGEPTHDVTMVGARRVQEQQRVTGGRRVEDDEAALRFGDKARKCVEHGHFLRARRPEVLFEERAALFVQIASFARHDARDVGLRLGHGVDTAHREILDRFRHGSRHVCGRIRRAEVHWNSPRSELDGHGRRHGRLADAPFSHHHHEAVPTPRKLVDQARKRWKVRRVRHESGSLLGTRFVAQQGTQRIQSDHVEGLERHFVDGHGTK